MVIFRTLIISTLLVFSQILWAANLTTSVDRNQIGSGETLQLNVRFQGQTTAEPDFSPLEHNFEILSRSQQNKFSIINGSTSSYTEWQLQLLPKKTGKVLIPSLRLKGEVSDAIEITVAKQAISSNSPTQPVFVETEVDKNSVYVQEQVLLTLRIAHSVNLSGISSEELTIDQANIVKVDEGDFYKNINGVRHRIIELKFAIFPETSGMLTIPGIRFNTTIPDRSSRFSSSFFDRGGKQIVLRSDNKTIEVKPRPQNSGTGEWLPSSGISISEKWSRSLDELSAGEPITRTLHITAQGLAAAQLPPLIQAVGEGFKVYPDQPQLSDDTDSNGVIGTRSESMAIVPTHEGSITLPPVTLEWWDTVNNKVQTTILESQTLQVKPNTELANSAPSLQQQPVAPTGDIAIEQAEPETNGLIWLLLATNGLCLLAFIYLFIKLRQQPAAINQQTSATPSPGERELFKAVKKAARQNDLKTCRNAILAWARKHWGNPSLLTLQQVLQHSLAVELTADFNHLDQALYNSNDSETVDLLAITEKLEKLRQNSAKSGPKSSKNSLKPLYENS